MYPGGLLFQLPSFSPLNITDSKVTTAGPSDMALRPIPGYHQINPLGDTISPGCSVRVQALPILPVSIAHDDIDRIERNVVFDVQAGIGRSPCSPAAPTTVAPKVAQSPEAGETQEPGRRARSRRAAPYARYVSAFQGCIQCLAFTTPFSLLPLSRPVQH